MKWNNSLKELSNMLFFWFFGVLFFFLFRVLFIYLFSKQLGSSAGISDYTNIFIMGFRFDCTVLGYFLFIPFLLWLSLSWWGKFQLIKMSRRVAQVLFLILSPLICAITLNFYYEYNEQFNNFIFLGLYDDQSAVWKTIVEYYHPWLNLFAVLSVSVIGYLILRYFENKFTIYTPLVKVKAKWGRAILIVLVIFLFVGNARGTFTTHPARRKWAAVAKDPFLNKVVVNPFRSLMYAYGDFKQLDFDGNNPFGEEDLRMVFQKDSVAQVIEKVAKGNQIEKPKQVFLVIMESYDAWPLMDKYKSFGLSNNLSEVAMEGTHFTNFLPTYNATIYAYNAIVTGIPYCGVYINFLSTINNSYMTSIFTQFKEMGYATHFFYGGYLSWQHIGDFTSNQGCDKLYSGADAGWESSAGDWGVEDGRLFDLVLDAVDPDEYSLNVILTSSYHSPYAVDVHAKGFPYHSADDLPQEARSYYDEGMTIQELGHLWYGDHEIGRFMKQAKEKYPDGLYCFTGDHYGRRFVNHTPNLYEKSAVPFILYGKGIPEGKRDTPGDHVDIMPTLIELIAPEGFTYYSFGSSMFQEDKEYGMGLEKIIDRDSLFYFPQDAMVTKFDLLNGQTKSEEENKYKEEHQKRLMLAWHYVMRGEYLGKKQKQ